MKGVSSIKKSINGLLHEPLVHFLFIGAALFIFYNLTSEQAAREAPKRIVVTSSQLAQLTASFKRTRMRSPSNDELNTLIEKFVRDEVFYREALAMGLDQNDPQVRRRLRMKLEFILDDLSSFDVSDEVLTDYLQQHADKFRSEARITFQQVYLNPEKQKDLAREAKILLTRLKGGLAAESAGDHTLLPYYYNLASQSEITRTFGERFTEALITLKPGDWTGPVYSTYGGHLLKISERVEANLPALVDVRALVEREFLVQRRQEQKNLIYQRLRETYEVKIDALPSEKFSGKKAAEADVASTTYAADAQQ